MGKIVLISASFGGGHCVAAARLADRLRGQGYECQVVDLLELLPARLGPILRRAYRTQLALAPRSWTWVCRAQEEPAAGALAARLVRLAADRLRALCTPDTQAVVSTYPMASQLLGELRQHHLLAVPAITVLTDVSVHPLWIHQHIDAHIALHSVSAHNARALGAQDVMVGGPIVPPAFRPAEPGEKAAARATFGLPPDRPLALIVAGSWGVGQIARSAHDVAQTRLATPVVVTGHNRSARLRIAATGAAIPLGWIDDMPTLMRAADVVVQSGGGLSVQEALASGVPVVTYRPLPGHGLANAADLAAAGWAGWARTRADLPLAIANALQRARPIITAGDPTALVASIARGTHRDAWDYVATTIAAMPPVQEP